jgi:hypothetical protein
MIKFMEVPSGSFKVLKYSTVKENDFGIIKKGDIVIFKHTESGGYLTVDENLKERGRELLKAYIRIFKGDPKMVENEISAHSYFEIEIIENSSKSHPSFKLRHFLTGRYLGLKTITDKSTVKSKYSVYKKRRLLTLLPQNPLIETDKVK